MADTNKTEKAPEKADQQNKFCILDWYGLKVGPVFVETDKSGKPLADGPKGIYPMTFDFTEQTFGKYMTNAEFNREAIAFAKKNGWTVVKSIFDEKDAKHFLTEAEDIKDLLKKGVVHFKYKKVDKPAKVNKRTGEITPAVIGETVERFGTLCEALIRKTIGDIEQAAGKRHIPDNVIVYFDIHAVNKATGVEGDWRSFRLENFIDVID